MSSGYHKFIGTKLRRKFGCLSRNNVWIIYYRSVYCCHKSHKHTYAKKKNLQIYMHPGECVFVGCRINMFFDVWWVWSKNIKDDQGRRTQLGRIKVITHAQPFSVFLIIWMNSLQHTISLYILWEKKWSNQLITNWWPYWLTSAQLAQALTNTLDLLSSTMCIRNIYF